MCIKKSVGQVTFSCDKCASIIIEDMTNSAENIFVYLSQALAGDISSSPTQHRSVYVSRLIAEKCSDSEIFDFDVNDIENKKARFNKVNILLSESSEDIIAIKNIGEVV